jgi:hypothetical protein
MQIQKVGILGLPIFKGMLGLMVLDLSLEIEFVRGRRPEGL